MSNSKNFSLIFGPNGPRGRGIEEHFERLKLLVEISHKAQDPKDNYRLKIASIYSARGIIEIMLESAEKQEMVSFQNTDPKVSRKNFEQTIIPLFAHYHLIEKIRIHDFHRFGCLPPDPNIKAVFHGGPVKLTASKGMAAVVLTGNGPQFIQSGNSEVKDQRSLCNAEGHFFDDKTNSYLSIEEILQDFISSFPKAFEHYTKLMM